MSENKPDSAPWVDPDDAPDLSAADLSAAVWRVGDREVSAPEGQALLQASVRRGRPRSSSPKEPVKLRLDADVVAARRATGAGWQTRINDLLRATLHL